MTTETRTTPDVIDQLIAFGDLKVWSVLVTLFGDLTPERGDRIDGPALSVLTARIGIRPEALRVALHRLRKDDWIVTARKGRISAYGLSAHGQRETEAVRAHIYGAAAIPNPGWYTIIPPPQSGDAALPGWIPVGRDVFISPTKPDAASKAMVTAIGRGDLPDWVKRKVVPPDLERAFGGLAQVLVRGPVVRADMLDSVALRLLVLHHWRRLALRLMPEAEALMQPDWSGARCRRQVQQWLRDLPRVDPARIIGMTR